MSLVLSSSTNCNLGVIVNSHFAGQHVYSMLSVDGEVNSGACSSDVVCFHESTAAIHGYEPMESWRKLVNLCNWHVIDGQRFESEDYIVMIASSRCDYLRKDAEGKKKFFLVFPKNQPLSQGTFRGYWKASQGWEIPDRSAS